MSTARERFATTKNPPRSVGTVFDAMRNLPSGYREGALRGARAANAKVRERRLKDALVVDFSRKRGGR
ncbi:hypothetical protein [Reyranella sp.]|uniref:hypothetical protein n=1 Tax=Reyranella sp. TaxID=1929291 RepID=UPI00403549CE